VSKVGGTPIRAVGITATTINLGVIIAAGSPGTAFGASLNYDTDATTAIVRAMVEEVNASGGIAGRQVVVSYAYNDNTNGASDNQARQQEAICTRFTEDEKTFAVLAFNPAGVNYAYPCFAKHQTPIIDMLLADADTQLFQELSPWLIAPVEVNWGRMARTLPHALADAGYLDKTMGVFTYDRPTSRRTVKTLQDEIERRGGEVLEIAYSQATYDGLASSISAAILTFQSKHIDRVVMWAPQCGPLLIFSAQAESQQYRPRYALTTYNTPAYCASQVKPSSQLKGATGVGFLPASDASFEGAPPTTPREKACFARISKHTGETYSERAASGNAGFALGVCELFGFAQQALAPAKGLPLGNAEVAAYAARLGTSYLPINTFRTSFSPTKLDGADAYSLLDFREGCTCFGYSGGLRDVEG
jgi:ABC-type branched-subunit amino acid transport system substrate-binding protein